MSVQNFLKGKVNKENFGKMYVTQTIDGNECSIQINSTGNEEDAKMVGQVNGKLYIVEV